MTDFQDMTAMVEAIQRVTKPEFDSIKTMLTDLKQIAHDPIKCPNNERIKSLESWKKNCQEAKQSTSSKAWDITKIIITAAVGIIAIWLMVVIGLK